MRDNLVIFGRDRSDEFRYGEFEGAFKVGLETGGEFGEEMFHADSVVRSELDMSVVGV